VAKRVANRNHDNHRSQDFDIKFTGIALPQEEMSDLQDSFAGIPGAARMRARFLFDHRGEFLG
jgi:hypothetical protein